jgi:N-acetylglucosaminyldiphosphoundecaprenol N-acetyl-beta-D-mannosaminyltransferase
MQNLRLIKDKPDNRDLLLRASAVTRVAVGHALVDDCSSEGACASIISHAKKDGRPAYVVTANAQHIVLLNKDRELREIYGKADLVLADGVSLLIAAFLSGRAIHERITGVDIFRQLCGRAAENNLRVFLLGGRPGSAERAAEALKKDFAGLNCNTYCPPHGFEQSKSGLSAVADAITSYHPHLLFVALGAPKQEHWIYNYGLQLSVPVSVGVGGSFEMVGGVVPRAPLWIQHAGCEWLYRLCREPRRMWHRYTVGNIEFGTIVAAQWLRRALLNTCVRLALQNSFAAELQEIAMRQSERVASLLSILNPVEVARSQDPLAVDESGLYRTSSTLSHERTLHVEVIR